MRVIPKYHLFVVQAKTNDIKTKFGKNFSKKTFSHILINPIYKEYIEKPYEVSNSLFKNIIKCGVCGCVTTPLPATAIRENIDTIHGLTI